MPLQDNIKVKYEKLIKLGFSDATIENLERRDTKESKLFTTSEMRKVKGIPVKIVAVIYPNMTLNTVTAHNYHVINLEGAANISPRDLEPQIEKIEKQLRAIEWNGPFFQMGESEGKEALRIIPQTAKVMQAMEDFAFINDANLTMDRLRLKYLYDTNFGDLMGLVDFSAKNYADHFKVLTMHHSMGMPHINKAIDMLMVNKIDNKVPRAAIAAMVREAMTLPTAVKPRRHFKGIGPPKKPKGPPR